MSRLVRQVAFVEDEAGAFVEIDYVDTDNIRVDGKVAVITHVQIQMSHPDYRQDADRVMRAAQTLLDNALDDWGESGPVEVARRAPGSPERDDDEGLGMGHGDRS